MLKSAVALGTSIMIGAAIFEVGGLWIAGFTTITNSGAILIQEA